jgi:diaminopimelate epimerase
VTDHLLHRGAFAKFHALGNDYLVVDGDSFGRLNPAVCVALCHRHTGVGADGVLVRVPPRLGADVGLRIYNPDGSEAEKSGNGLRIFVHCLHAAGLWTAPTVRVAVGGSVVRGTLHRVQGTVADVEMGMGTAAFTSDALHMTGAARVVVGERIKVADAAPFEITAVSVGNPHCVRFVDALDVAELRRLGPALERHSTFTQRTNVQLAKVVSRTRVDILIWERGAGETSASGSSSCAVVAAARRLGLVDSSVTVHMPGGTLSVTVTDDYGLTLRGISEAVCWGSLA